MFLPLKSGINILLICFHQYIGLEQSLLITEIPKNRSLYRNVYSFSPKIRRRIIIEFLKKPLRIKIRIKNPNLMRFKSNAFSEKKALYSNGIHRLIFGLRLQVLSVHHPNEFIVGSRRVQLTFKAISICTLLVKFP